MDINQAQEIFDEPEPFVAEQWLKFLSDEQINLEDEVLGQLSDNTQFQFHIILGGAGTGKTQVLLLLAQELQESGHRVGYFTTSGVRSMIEKAGLDIPSENLARGAVHLVDDPTEVGQVTEALKRAKAFQARALVVAIDPFQWTERTAFLKLATILGEHNPAEDLLGRRNTLVNLKNEVTGVPIHKHYLKTAYRQTKVAGTGSIGLSNSIFQRMNPYVRSEKMTQFASITRPFVDNLLGGLSHVSEGGSFEIIEDGTAEQVWKALSMFASRSDRWTWTESALFVFDGSQGESKWSDYQVEIPGVSDQPGFDVDTSLWQILPAMNVRGIRFSDPISVRGQEFQDVLICISRRRWSQFRTAKTGMDGPSWASIMPIHTFTTRAIDSVLIIVY